MLQLNFLTFRSQQSALSLPETKLSADLLISMPPLLTKKNPRIFSFLLFCQLGDQKNCRAFFFLLGYLDAFIYKQRWGEFKSPYLGIYWWLRSISDINRESWGETVLKDTQLCWQPAKPRSTYRRYIRNTCTYLYPQFEYKLRRLTIDYWLQDLGPGFEHGVFSLSFQNVFRGSLYHLLYVCILTYVVFNR